MGNEHLPRALLQSWKAPPHQSLPENLGVTQSEADSCEDIGSDRGNGQEGGWAVAGGQGPVLTALGDVAVFPRHLAVLQHMTPRLGIPIWVPRG